VNEGGRDGLALTVEWDRDPGRGFRWFSPYWLANERDGSTYIVGTIASIGLVNNPNIPEFRLANEAEDNKQIGDKMRERLLKELGLPPDATDDQIWESLGEYKRIYDDRAAAEERAKAAAKEEAKADLEEAKAEADTAKAALENEKKAHDTTKTALANEKAARADMVLDAAVRERRIGETARETWKTRLVNEGDAAYAALANEKPLSTTDRAKGLVNECGSGTDHEKRMALVNEIMASDKVGYDEAWTRAEKRDPVLFGKK
jgi:hypothetical protein